MHNCVQSFKCQSAKFGEVHSISLVEGWTKTLHSCGCVLAHVAMRITLLEKFRGYKIPLLQSLSMVDQFRTSGSPGLRDR
jgi:hypothetical protein